MIKAVVFDLDGTLLDSIEDIANTCNIILAKRGYQALPIKDYYYYVGKGVKNLIQRIMEASQINQDLFDDLMADYYSIYKDEASKTTHVYPGIHDLLKALKEKNISSNVLSNKPHIQVLDLMPQYFDEDTFKIIYGKKEAYKAKPDPALLNELIKNLKLDKSEILYVGDTKTDIETAINAGLTSVGVLWGFRDEAELKAAQASYIVSHPLEILTIIKDLKNDTH